MYFQKRITTALSLLIFKVFWISTFQGLYSKVQSRHLYSSMSLVIQYGVNKASTKENVFLWKTETERCFNFSWPGFGMRLAYRSNRRRQSYKDVLDGVFTCCKISTLSALRCSLGTELMKLKYLF